MQYIILLETVDSYATEVHFADSLDAALAKAKRLEEICKVESLEIIPRNPVTR